MLSLLRKVTGGEEERVEERSAEADAHRRPVPQLALDKLHAKPDHAQKERRGVAEQANEHEEEREEEPPPPVSS